MTIDLYLQHRIDPNVPVEESIGTLAELVSEGKVRFIGLSDTTPDVIRRANAVHPISVLQSEYSLVERGVEDDILGVCEELGVGFMAFSPLCRGLLTGQLVDTTVLDEGDVRKTNHFPRVGPDFLQTNAGILEPLRDVADQDRSQAQVALAWLLAQRPYVVPIPGPGPWMNSSVTPPLSTSSYPIRTWSCSTDSPRRSRANAFVDNQRAKRALAPRDVPHPLR